MASQATNRKATNISRWSRGTWGMLGRKTVTSSMRASWKKNCSGFLNWLSLDMLISNSLLYFRREESEHWGVFACVFVCVWHVQHHLDLSWVEESESSRPRDDPSGLFPYKTYGKMQKLFFFSLFLPTIAINIEHRAFAHAPLRIGIPSETQSSWRIRKKWPGIFTHSPHVFSVCKYYNIVP